MVNHLSSDFLSQSFEFIKKVDILMVILSMVIMMMIQGQKDEDMIY